MRKGSAREKCGKVCFTSHGSASRAARRATVRDEQDIRVYWHPPCGSYHLTSESTTEYNKLRSEDRQ